MALTPRLTIAKAPFLHPAAIAPIGRITPSDDMALHLHGRKGTVAGGQRSGHVTRQPEGVSTDNVGGWKIPPFFL